MRANLLKKWGVSGPASPEISGHTRGRRGKPGNTSSRRPGNVTEIIDPVAHAACHAAEAFYGFFEILVEPGCARDRFSRTDDEHQQRVVLPKADDADRQGRFREPDGIILVGGKESHGLVDVRAVPAIAFMGYCLFSSFCCVQDNSGCLTCDLAAVVAHGPAGVNPVPVRGTGCNRTGVITSSWVVLIPSI